MHYEVTLIISFSQKSWNTIGNSHHDYVPILVNPQAYIIFSKPKSRSAITQRRICVQPVHFSVTAEDGPLVTP